MQQCKTIKKDKEDKFLNSSTDVRDCACVAFGAQKEYKGAGDTLEGLREGHQSVAKAYGRVAQRKSFAHVDRHEECVAT